MCMFVYLNNTIVCGTNVHMAKVATAAIYMASCVFWGKMRECTAGEVVCDLQVGVGVTGSFPTNIRHTPGVVSTMLRFHLAFRLLGVSTGRVFPEEDRTPGPSPPASSYPRKTMMKSSTFQPLRR